MSIGFTDGMGNPFESKFNGKCKAGCGATWKAGDQVYGLGSHICSNQNCKMPGTEKPPQTESQLQNVPDAPATMEGAIVEYTTQIIQIRQVVAQTVRKYDPNPNPAMIGQIVGLVWDHIKHHNGGVQK